MHITQSQQLAESTQAQQSSVTHIHQERVTVLTQDQAQQQFDEGGDIQAIANGHEVVERKRQATHEASVTLELTTTHSDRLALDSASIVSREGAATASFVSSSIAEAVSTASSSSEFTVSRSRLTNGSNREEAGEFVQVTNIQTVESDQMIEMTAQGSVKTTDGRDIGYLMQFEFERHSRFEQSNEFVGHVDLIDPIMINLNGEAVALQNEVFDFDLNADGQLDAISKTASGTGYLVFDRNNNGVIDDGTELFGPSTGSGYSELAELDDDRNGWIDSGDAAFAQFGVWQFNSSGESYILSASDAGLGAVSLTHADTQYQMFDSNGELQAEVKNTGVALMESGAVAVVQELNLRNFIEQQSPSISANAQGMINLAEAMNPLTTFQASENEIIAARVAETEVRINRANMFSLEQPIQPLMRIDVSAALNANSLASVSLEQVAEPNNSTLSQTVEAQIVARMRANLDVSVQNCQPTTPSVWTPDAAEFRYLEDLPSKWQFDQTPEDGLLERLKALVESLKEIQQHQETMLKKLDIYQQVGQMD